MMSASVFALYNALFWCAFAASAILTRLVTHYLLRKAALDRPVHRSIHDIPRPVGGGWGVTPVVIVMLSATGYAFGASLFFYTVMIGAVILAVISWLDDLHPIKASTRFITQGVIVIACLYTAPHEWAVLDGYVPIYLDRILTGIAWLWFINLYNFMDGIDGLTGVETGMLGLGGAMLLIMTTSPDPLVIQAGWILGGAGFGFLVWNWHPARVFIGDTGSIPLGFMMGWFLLSMGVNNLFWAAVLISLYYCADASLTIISRIIHGKKFWEADQTYAFQQAVIKGYDHDQVVKIIALVNIFLWACAFTITFPKYPISVPFVIFMAALVTGIIIAHFHGKINLAQKKLRKT